MLTSLTKQTDRLMSFMKLILKVSIGAARLKGKQAAGSRQQAAVVSTAVGNSYELGVSSTCPRILAQKSIGKWH